MSARDPLDDATVRREIAMAWRDSEPDHPQLRHEEGGYIVVNFSGSYEVDRWPRGTGSTIVPPPLDANGCYNERVVVATFHTHPNPAVDELGREWDQAPSGSDRRWHHKRKLRGIVVSRDLVYEIAADAQVSVLGAFAEVL